MDYIIHNGELYHWGIKGMKWGQRRYQNKDGSLTPAGVKRYNKEVQKLKDREASIKRLEQAKKYQSKLDKKKSELDEREAALKGKPTSEKTTKSANNAIAVKTKSGTKTLTKSISDMSDDELKAFVDRVDLENKYRTALASTLPPAKISKGKKFVDFTLEKVLAPAAEDVGKSVAKAAMKKFAGAMTNLELDDKKKK